MTFLGVAKMQMTWLDHCSVAGRKKDRDVVWTAGKEGGFGASGRMRVGQ